MDYLQKYNYVPSEESISRHIQNIAQSMEGMANRDLYKKCFSLMDLTTLHTNDTEESVLKLVRKVNELPEKYPDYPLPASICVFPNFAHVVRAGRISEEVHVTTVSSCFPSAQSFLEVKVRECELAVEDGADEVDIVLALNSFLAGDYEKAAEEIRVIKAAIDAKAASLGRKVILKAILETGLLVTPENIARASFLAMEAGADFIKTSTGKVEVNATPMAAYIMCECIRRYYEVSGRKVGFKAAGGISTAKDAAAYFLIVSSVLGKEWLDKSLFRFGVSRLGNSLMGEIEQQTIKFF